MWPLSDREAQAEIHAKRLDLVLQRATPDEISGWAIDNGLVGQMSPFGQAVWPIAFTMLWIAWQNQEQIEREYLDLLYSKKDMLRDTSKSTQKMSLYAAQLELWAALIKGSLPATAIDERTDERVEVRSEAWIDLILYPADAMMTAVSSRLAVDVPRYNDVRFARHDVLKLWSAGGSPAEAGAVQQKVNTEITQPAKPSAGGRPPRIDDWHNMWIEVCRVLQTETSPPNSPLEMRKYVTDWFTDQGLEEPANQTLTPLFKRLFRTLNG